MSFVPVQMHLVLIFKWDLQRQQEVNERSCPAPVSVNSLEAVCNRRGRISQQSENKCGSHKTERRSHKRWWKTQHATVELIVFLYSLGFCALQNKGARLPGLWGSKTEFMNMVICKRHHHHNHNKCKTSIYWHLKCPSYYSKKYTAFSTLQCN